MSDREKVIKELESLRDICNAKSNVAIGNGKITWAGYANAADDALALLKEQEPVKQKVSEWLEDSDPGQEYGTTWACRKCMHSIHKPYIWNPYNSGYKYCPHCGAMMEVSWDE